MRRLPWAEGQAWKVKLIVGEGELPSYSGCFCSDGDRSGIKVRTLLCLVAMWERAKLPRSCQVREHCSLAARWLQAAEASIGIDARWQENCCRLLR